MFVVHAFASQPENRVNDIWTKQSKENRMPHWLEAKLETIIWKQTGSWTTHKPLPYQFLKDKNDEREKTRYSE